MKTNNKIIFDLFPYVYKSADAHFRTIDSAGWDEVFEPTTTPIGHSKRLIIEWIIDTISIFLSFLLCLFLWHHKRIMITYKKTISFITFGSHILIWPFYILSTWQTIILIFGAKNKIPSVLHCTLIEFFILAFFKASALITFPVAINRFLLLLKMNQLKLKQMIMIHIIILFFEHAFTLGHMAVGEVSMTFVCSRLIASKNVWKSMLISNSIIQLFTIFINFFSVIYFCFFNRMNSIKNEIKRKNEKNISIMLLIQSLTQTALTLPLIIRQWLILILDSTLDNFACKYGYMFSLSTIFLGPFVSMMCIQMVRQTIWKVIFCQKTYKSTKINSKNNFVISAVL